MASQARTILETDEGLTLSVRRVTASNVQVVGGYSHDWFTLSSDADGSVEFIDCDGEAILKALAKRLGYSVAKVAERVAA